jgi:hypothetical protein
VKLLPSAFIVDHCLDSASTRHRVTGLVKEQFEWRIASVSGTGGASLNMRSEAVWRFVQ